MILRLLTRLIPLFLATGALGCGYHFVNASAPYGVSTIAITPFQEKEPVGISQSLAREIAIQFAQRGISVRNRPSTNAGQLKGTVTSSTVKPAPTSSVDASVPSYLLRITVEARLLGVDGATLWRNTYTLHDTFLSATGYAPEAALITEAQRRKAMRRLAREFSNRITEDLVLASSLSSSGDPHNAGSN